MKVEVHRAHCWLCNSFYGFYEHATIGLCDHCQEKRRPKPQRPPNRAERRAAKRGRK